MVGNRPVDRNKFFVVALESLAIVLFKGNGPCKMRKQTGKPFVYSSKN
jgi:hypothetical protein